MEFPTYKPQDETPLDPVNAYRGFMWDDAEQRYPVSYNSSPLQTASRLILESMTDENSDGSRLRFAQQMLDKEIGEGRHSDSYHPGKLRELQLIAGILEGDNDPASLHEKRAEYHGAVIDNLRTALDDYDLLWMRTTGNNTPDKTSLGYAVGDITHYTALALITRLRHPRLMAVSATPYQDRSRWTARNFDFALIETFKPETLDNPDDEVKVHKVQVKAHCFGECPGSQHGHLGNGSSSTLLENERQSYNKDIVLVSGCDDLMETGIRENNPAATDLARLLLREADDTAWSTAIRTLNFASSELIRTITSNEGRRGKRIDRGENQPARPKPQFGSVGSTLGWIREEYGLPGTAQAAG